jgi:hypothetical protein
MLKICRRHVNCRKWLPQTDAEWMRQNTKLPQPCMSLPQPFMVLLHVLAAECRSQSRCICLVAASCRSQVCCINPQSIEQCRGHINGCLKTNIGKNLKPVAVDARSLIFDFCGSAT